MSRQGPLTLVSSVSSGSIYAGHRKEGREEVGDGEMEKRWVWGGERERWMREATGRMEYFSYRRDKGNQSHYWLVIQTVLHGQNKCRNTSVPNVKKHSKFAAPLAVCTYYSTEMDAWWITGVFYTLGSLEKPSDPVLSKCINLVNHQFSIFNFFSHSQALYHPVVHAWTSANTTAWFQFRSIVHTRT